MLRRLVELSLQKRGIVIALAIALITYNLLVHLAPVGPPSDGPERPAGAGIPSQRGRSGD